jgi:hypothetical protein
MCAPSAIRTRDPLLRRHFRAVARRCRTWPDVVPSCTDSRWLWPGMASCLPVLAPRLAPPNLISDANVRILEHSSGLQRRRLQPGSYPAGSIRDHQPRLSGARGMARAPSPGTTRLRRRPTPRNAASRGHRAGRVPAMSGRRTTQDRSPRPPAMRATVTNRRVPTAITFPTCRCERVPPSHSYAEASISIRDQQCHERYVAGAGTHPRVGQIADYSLLCPLALGSVVEHISGRSGAMI